jgi:hypothetical protein
LRIPGKSLEPAAAVTVQLLYDDTRTGGSHAESYEAVIFPLDGMIDVEDVFTVDHDDRDFSPEPLAGASYQLGNAKLQNKTFWTSLQADIKTWLVANRSIETWKNPGLKLYSRVGESQETFRARCEEAADQAADFKVAQLRERYAKRIDTLQAQISSADARVRELEVDASARTQTEMMSGIGDLLGGILSGKFGSHTMGKVASRRAATRKAKARLATAEEKLSARQQDLAELESEMENALISIRDEHATLAATMEPLEIGLEKTDIRVAEAKLVWVPVA